MEMDSYRIGTLLELVRTVAIDLYSEGLNVRVCVQGSMGEGAFTGLPRVTYFFKSPLEPALLFMPHLPCRHTPILPICHVRIVSELLPSCFRTVPLVGALRSEGRARTDGLAGGRRRAQRGSAGGRR